MGRSTRAQEDVRDLVEAAKKLIEFEVVNVDVVTVFELLEGVGTAVELIPSWPDREVAERFDVVMLQPKRPYSRLEQRNFLVRVAVGASRERRDCDDLLAVDLLSVEVTVALNDGGVVVTATLVVVGGPADVVLAVAPSAGDLDDFARHTAAFDDAGQVVASNAGGDDESGTRGHRLLLFQELLKVFHLTAADRPDEHSWVCDEVARPLALWLQLRVGESKNVKVFWIPKLADPAAVTVKTGHC